MRCLNWVEAMHGAGFLLPMPKERLIDFAKEIEGWTFGGFAPIVTEPTPMGTIEEAMDAVMSRSREVMNSLPPEAIEKKQAMGRAFDYWQRFMADMSAAIAMPSA